MSEFGDEFVTGGYPVRARWEREGNTLRVETLPLEGPQRQPSADRIPVHIEYSAEAREDT